MTHLVCHYCGGSEHTVGYGLAAGPLGHYTICHCGTILEFTPDLQGVSDEQAQRIRASITQWRTAMNAVRERKGLPPL